MLSRDLVLIPRECVPSAVSASRYRLGSNRPAPLPVGDVEAHHGNHAPGGGERRGQGGKVVGFESRTSCFPFALISVCSSSRSTSLSWRSASPMDPNTTRTPPAT